MVCVKTLKGKAFRWEVGRMRRATLGFVV